MPARDALYEQIALRLRERCFLLDVDWIYELTAAAPQIDDAIDEALQHDLDAHERGERPTDAERHRYRLWNDVFQIELADARRAAVTFNSLDSHSRRVFFALIIEERSIEDCVDAGLGERETLGRTVRSVFKKLMDGRAAR